MKIAVLGAGAMGSLYGAKLSRTQDVTMVDVNETLIDHINQNSIVVQEADGTVSKVGLFCGRGCNFESLTGGFYGFYS